MDVLWRAWGEVGEANLFHRRRRDICGPSGAVSRLATLVLLYGLAFDPSEVEKRIGALSSILSAETLELLSRQLHSFVEASGGALGLGQSSASAGAIERVPRHERDHCRGQHRLRGKGATRLFTLNFVALGLTWASWPAASSSSRSLGCCRRPRNFLPSARERSGCRCWCNGPCWSS